jgi:nicotinate-nucleotide pyrophosphorylase (carboxylating)
VVPAPPHPPRAAWLPLVDRALAEDVGAGDVTSSLVLAEEARLEAVLEARAALVVCGLRVAEEVLRRVDASIEVCAAAEEGSPALAGQALLHLAGPARAILTAERTALNFVGRMAGVATLTGRFVERVAGTGAAIVDTRKTLPGWRVLDKYAVAVGGGVNHRAGLFDAVLIKDNHVAAAGGVAPAVKAALAGAPAHLWIQVEVESEAQAEESVAAGARALLLDNMALGELRRIADRFRERVVLEASGGVTLANVRDIAETGVHRISVGALTHSAPAADVALEAALRRREP